VLHEDDFRRRLTHGVGNVSCDLLKGCSFNVEMHETVVFRLFNGGDSTVHIMSRRMRNYSVTVISELVNYVVESVVF
jgi:hypothetical protein